MKPLVKKEGNKRGKRELTWFVWCVFFAFVSPKEEKKTYYYYYYYYCYCFYLFILSIILLCLICNANFCPFITLSLHRLLRKFGFGLDRITDIFFFRLSPLPFPLKKKLKKKN